MILASPTLSAIGGGLGGKYDHANRPNANQMPDAEVTVVTMINGFPFNIVRTVHDVKFSLSTHPYTH
jgi:adenosine/AMP kinase